MLKGVKSLSPAVFLFKPSVSEDPVVYEESDFSEDKFREFINFYGGMKAAGKEEL